MATSPALRRSPRLGGFSQVLGKAIGKGKSSKGKTQQATKSVRRKKTTSTAAKGSSSSSSTTGPTRQHEIEKWNKGFKVVAGVDEAGRGPLVGPVVAAACILHKDDVELVGLNDSKKMTEQQREACYDVLVSSPDSISYAWHAIDAKTIDEINILQASLKAMETAVSKLPARPDFVLIDGNRIPKQMDPSTTESIVKGDGKSLVIAAASVIAKVVRDRMMLEMHKEYPQYGFDKHKGYGVPQHLEAIKRHGPCPYHRRTFAPIKYM